ncbi:HupE/UreJ family protein [Mesorhizobium sp. J8]|nr:HupE/UreJ family protein [Mesorhizobium sp. J8]BCM17526.1 HupE/UreJ family protein [Mesorhizobium sp. J8]
MRRTVLKLASAEDALAALADPAFAHLGVGHTDGFAAGMVHPLLGLDYLMAMAGVGIWSATAAPSRPWAAPAAFVGMMVAGAALSFVGICLPAVEGMIALSVLVLGLMIVAGAGLPTARRDRPRQPLRRLPRPRPCQRGDPRGPGLCRGLHALDRSAARARRRRGAEARQMAQTRAGIGILVAGFGAALVFGG